MGRRIAVAGRLWPGMSWRGWSCLWGRLWHVEPRCSSCGGA